MRHAMEELVRDRQRRIVAALEELDGGRFAEDAWERDGGGGGVTRVLQDSRVFEKAGVNVASVWGELSPEAETAMRDRGRLGAGSAGGFAAVGLSVVLHPVSPLVPTVHCNYRYFELAEEDSWWFGGGADLTPSYLSAEDAAHFHRTLKAACDAHDPDFYPRFKRWCDDYFHLPHRGERRGVGGIFFDDLRDRPADRLFDFVRSCLDAFLPSYLPIVERRLGDEWGARERRWQRLRRGRYVEFNLMYDRGTRFGLRTGGRVESILMSLPLAARWEYAPAPEPGSPEAELLRVLRQPREWV